MKKTVFLLATTIFTALPQGGVCARPFDDISKFHIYNSHMQEMLESYTPNKRDALLKTVDNMTKVADRTRQRTFNDALTMVKIVNLIQHRDFREKEILKAFMNLHDNHENSDPQIKAVFDRMTRVEEVRQPDYDPFENLFDWNGRVTLTALETRDNWGGNFFTRNGWDNTIPEEYHVHPLTFPRFAPDLYANANANRTSAETQYNRLLKQALAYLSSDLDPRVLDGSAPASIGRDVNQNLEGLLNRFDSGLVRDSMARCLTHQNVTDRQRSSALENVKLVFGVVERNTLKREIDRLLAGNTDLRRDAAMQKRVKIQRVLADPSAHRATALELLAQDLSITIDALQARPTLEADLTRSIIRWREEENIHVQRNDARQNIHRNEQNDVNRQETMRVHEEEILVMPAFASIKKEMQDARIVFSEFNAGNPALFDILNQYDLHQQAYPRHYDDVRAHNEYERRAASIQGDLDRLSQNDPILVKLRGYINQIAPHLREEVNLSLNKILRSKNYLKDFFEKLYLVIPWLEYKRQSNPQVISTWLNGSFGESARAYPENTGDERVSCPKGIVERCILGLQGLDPGLDKILSISYNKIKFKFIISGGDQNIVREMLRNFNIRLGENAAKVEWVRLATQALEKFHNNAIIRRLNEKLALFNLPRIDAQNCNLTQWKTQMSTLIRDTADAHDWEDILLIPLSPQPRPYFDLTTGDLL